MRTPLFALIFMIALVSPAAAQTITLGNLRLDFSDEAMRPRSDRHKQFVASYLAAVGSGKPDAIRALVHPASLACSTSPPAREYLHEIHTRDANRSIPLDARVIIVPMTGDLPMAPVLAEMTKLPVSATEIFALDYKAEERDSKGVLTRHVGGTVMRQLAPDGDRLAIVEYCLTEKGETAWRQKRDQKRDKKG